MRWLITVALLFLAVSRGSTQQPRQSLVTDPAERPVLAVVLRADPEPEPVPYGQQIAQARADYMARYNYRGHPPRSAGNWMSVPGAGFEGVGWRGRNTPHRSVGTCRPSGRSGPHDDNSRVLLGDAVAYSSGGSYRVRIWGRR